MAKKAKKKAEQREFLPEETELLKELYVWEETNADPMDVEFQWAEAENLHQMGLVEYDDEAQTASLTRKGSQEVRRLGRTRWTVEAGRQIYFDGKPFISVGREGKTSPVQVDGSVHDIVECFNRALITPDDIHTKHMARNPQPEPKADKKLKSRLLR